MMLRGDSEIKILHVQYARVPSLIKLATMPTYEGGLDMHASCTCMHAHTHARSKLYAISGLD